jgi:hypothetical protein
MTLSAEWRTSGDHDAVLVVDDSNEVREAMVASPEVLRRFLTNLSGMHTWRGGGVAADKRTPDAWGELVMARAQSGEVLVMDPELFWNGIYTWFRSRGVDYDSVAV